MKHSATVSLLLVCFLVAKPFFSRAFQIESFMKKDSDKMEQLSGIVDVEHSDLTEIKHVEDTLRRLGTNQHANKQWKSFKLFSKVRNGISSDDDAPPDTIKIPVFNEQCFKDWYLRGSPSANWKGSCSSLPCNSCSFDEVPYNCLAAFEFRNGVIQVQYLWKEKVIQGTKHWFAVTGGTGIFTGATGIVKATIMEDTATPDSLEPTDIYALIKFHFYVLCPR
mmetsp:Transcript_7720/g.11252  ORF Transcript_7720/g.11252 Transcript_7720/m.11252 type:complete len:222 (+) Transcript_7720:67-732(+)